MKTQQEEMYDLSELINRKKPNLEDLESFIIEQHPYYEDKREYTRAETCCFDTGAHSCLIGTTSEKSSIDQFGITPTLYFRFLKNLAQWFFVFSILTLIPISAYIKSFSQSSSKVTQMLTASEKLAATTIGALVIDKTLCQYLLLSSPSSSSSSTSTSTTSSNDDNSLILECQTGKLSNDISNYYYGLATNQSSDSSSSSCFFQDISSIDQSCNNPNLSKISDLISTKCFNQTQCQVTLDSSIFASDSNCQSKAANQKVFFSTACTNESLTVISTFQKEEIVILASILDASIMVLFMLMLLKLRFSQEETERNVMNNSVSVSYFTLEFVNLPQDFLEDEFKYKLQTHLEELAEKVHEEKDSLKIYDIQLASPENIVCVENKIMELSKKRLELILNYCTHLELVCQDNSLTHSQILKHQDELTEPKDKKKGSALLKEIEDLYVLIEQEKYKRHQLEHQSRQRILSAYVTFQTIKNRDQVYSLMYQSTFDRLRDSFFFCCKKKVDVRRFGGKLLAVKIPPNPEDIVWENFSMSIGMKFARRFVSYFVTFLFLIGTLMFIVFVKKKNQDFINKYPVVSCPSNSNILTPQEVVKDYESPVSKGLLECYCKINTLNKLDEEFMMSDGSEQKLCKSWFEDQTLLVALPFLVVLVTIFINFIMEKVFIYLSKFEGFKYVSHEISSRVSKIFFMQFMNTALIVLLMNARFRSISNATIAYLLSGTFSDFDPIWFLQVGSTIILTLGTYIIMPYINYMVSKLLYALKQWYDRGFTCNKEKTRKQNQEQYQKVYLGPPFLIEIRYSQILNIIFVCFLYSMGLPSLIITTFLFIMSVYIVDKFVMLRLSRMPPTYSKNLEDIVRSVLWLAVPFHCVLSIWMLGSDKMFNGSIKSVILSSISSSVTVQQSDTSVTEEFFQRMVKAQCIPQLIVLCIFLLYVFYLVIKRRVILPLIDLICNTKADESKIISNHNKLADIPFYQFLTKQDIHHYLVHLENLIQDCEYERYKHILEHKKKLLNRVISSISKRLSKSDDVLKIEKKNHISCKLVGAYSYDNDLPVVKVG